MNVGDKVVAINHKSAGLSIERPAGIKASHEPVIGRVYVISEVYWHPSFGTRFGLGLVGVTVVDGNGNKAYWDSRCFRPLEEVQAENREKVTDAIGKDVQP